MGKRILGIIVAIAVGYLIYLGYVRYRDSHDDTGEIHGDTPVAASSSDSSDGDAAPAARPKPVVVQSAPQPAAASAIAPAADSISPQPANGMAYAGSGKFQVYRQGNLTWRVDTGSGRSCVLFATMEEWKKPIVYQNGCNAK